MKKLTKFLSICALSALTLLASVTSAQAGRMIVTGHDIDEHSANRYFDWGMTYLMNGTGVGYATDTSTEATTTIAFLGNTNRPGVNGGYSVDFFDLDNTNWTNVFAGNYDVIVIGSGSFTVSSGVNGSGKLNSQAAAFESYFNGGGNLFVNTEQGLGNSFYNFLPAFGATNNASLPGCYSGAPGCMRPTTEGAALGMNNSIINQADITHTRFTNVDSAFTVVEEYYNNGGIATGDAITLAFAGTIACDPSNPAASCYVPPKPPSGVPEASSIMLLGLGLVGLGFTRRKKQA